MNVSHFITRIFTPRIDIATIRQTGINDGQAAAAAYVDGFLQSAEQVLNDRLNAFHETEQPKPEPEPQLIETVELSTPVKRLTKKAVRR